MKDTVARYLEKRADLEAHPLVSGPLDAIELAVVIPMLAERGTIEDTLAGLARNPRKQLDRTIVIGVVNNRRAPDTAAEVISNNAETLELLDDLVHGSGTGALAGLRVGYIDASSAGRELGPKQGVGAARKLGLDWGAEVLRPGPASPRVLVNLDADTWVEPNYLEAVTHHFEQPDAWAAIVDFAHRFDGPSAQREAIVAYELFLRYHVLGLHYAGSPYAFHTVGSTMACTSRAYAAVGGMNRRQAGEDFYFLQELAKTGRVDAIHQTVVHPSSRPSWRVPFGTGRRVERVLKEPDIEHRVYHPESYEILKAWLRLVRTQPDTTAPELLARAFNIDPALGGFLTVQNFEAVWPGLCKHAADTTALLRQFDRWFDGFKTLKLMHHLRDNGHPEQDASTALDRLLANTRTGANVDSAEASKRLRYLRGGASDAGRLANNPPQG